MLLFVPPDRQEMVKETCNTLIHVPFQFENGGSQIIFYDPEMDYREEEESRKSRPIQAFYENPLLQTVDAKL